MHLQLTNIGKRYNREWIFRHLDYRFESGKRYAITGNNGSGKSTLLQVIGGAITLSEGKIDWMEPETAIDPGQIFQHMAVAAPYLELIEEMTALEFLHFHQQFKPLQLPAENVLEAVQLGNAANKQIRYFSSGMKQRLKLGQAICSQAPVLLLDEPTTNLDTSGIALYHQLIADFAAQKTILVSSNDPQEYSFCEAVVAIQDFKTN